MNGSYVTNWPGTGRFPLVAGGRAAPLAVDSADYPGVVRAVDDLRSDIESVTGVGPAISPDQVPTAADVVVIGTIGRSPLVDGLVAAGRLDVDDIEGKWETTLETVVERPWPGVDRAFVIAGSDQLGTIYGAYDLSKQIGVSPWHWWDDVTPARQDALYVLPGRHSQGTPAVKYRGFFINDENPDLGTWGPEAFGPGLGSGLSERLQPQALCEGLRGRPAAQGAITSGPRPGAAPSGPTIPKTRPRPTTTASTSAPRTRRR